MRILIVLAGLALVVVLLGIIALGAPAFAPLAAPLIPIAAVIALAALALVRLLCEISRCRLLGIVGWALKSSRSDFW